MLEKVQQLEENVNLNQLKFQLETFIKSRKLIDIRMQCQFK